MHGQIDQRKTKNNIKCEDDVVLLLAEVTKKLYMSVWVVDMSVDDDAQALLAGWGWWTFGVIVVSRVRRMKLFGDGSKLCEEDEPVFNGIKEAVVEQVSSNRKSKVVWNEDRKQFSRLFVGFLIVFSDNTTSSSRIWTIIAYLIHAAFSNMIPPKLEWLISNGYKPYRAAAHVNIAWQ